jgi:hypothetical protein
MIVKKTTFFTIKIKIEYLNGILFYITCKNTYSVQKIILKHTINILKSMFLTQI